MCGLQSTKELGSLVKLERGGCEHLSSLVVASWASETMKTAGLSLLLNARPDSVQLAECPHPMPLVKFVTLADGVKNLTKL